MAALGFSQCTAQHTTMPERGSLFDAVMCSIKLRCVDFGCWAFEECLRLVLTKQGCLSQDEQNQFLNQTHPLHGRGFCLAAQQMGLPTLISSSSQTPVQVAHVSRSAALSTTRLANVMWPTRQGCTSLKPPQMHVSRRERPLSGC